MTSQQPSIDRKKLERAHRGVLDAASALRAGVRLGEVTEPLGTLSNVLRKHFSEEEAAGGLFDRIVDLHPGAAPDVDALREDHRAIREAAADLQRLAAGTPGGCGGDVARAAEALVARIQAHEARETRLLAEVMSLELGGPGGG